LGGWPLPPPSFQIITPNFAAGTVCARINDNVAERIHSEATRRLVILDTVQKIDAEKVIVIDFRFPHHGISVNTRYNPGP